MNNEEGFQNQITTTNSDESYDIMFYDYSFLNENPM